MEKSCDISGLLKALRNAMEKSMNGDEAQLAAIKTLLEILEERQQETNDLLRAVNGNVRTHDQLLAKHAQWIESHQAIHKGIEKRLDGRINGVEKVQETLSDKQETQGEKIARLVAEVGKWGLLITLILNILMQLWPAK